MDITIVLPVSRPDFLQRVFAQLDLMPCDRERVSLFVYIDGDYNLYEKARNFCENSKFVRKLCIYRSKGPTNVGSIRKRRQRIADIHNEIKQYLKQTDYIFLLEDDTVPPLSTLKRFEELAYQYPHAGIITGVEVGRWGFTHIGAWRVNDVYNIKDIQSIPKEVGVQEIDASGIYCCFIKYSLYIQHYFEPFENILGPDVNLGLALRKQGYKNYIDHNLICDHLYIDHSTITKVSLLKIIEIYFNKFGEHWIQSVKE